MRRVKIADVAEAAGVSTATVSLALNDPNSRISRETRARVKRIASEIGYAPNSIARSLRTSRTHMIGLISDQIAITPFAGRMLAGAQLVAISHSHLVILIDSAGQVQIEGQAINALRDQQVDAMVFARMWHQVIDVPEGLPDDTVFLNCRPTQPTHRAVVPDDEGGGRAAVREVLEAGHTKIAYLDVDEPVLPIASAMRYGAFREELEAAGIAFDPRCHVRVPTTAAGGRAGCDQLLDLGPDRPTAIVCFNDRIAAGVYGAAQRRGLAIPHDLSVVGYDDQQLIASELDPPLTTVALPHAEMGQWAMEVAMGLREVDPSQPTYKMPCPLVRRESVAPPP